MDQTLYPCIREKGALHKLILLLNVSVHSGTFEGQSVLEQIKLLMFHLEEDFIAISDKPFSLLMVYGRL